MGLRRGYHGAKEGLTRSLPVKRRGRNLPMKGLATIDTQCAVPLEGMHR